MKKKKDFSVKKENTKKTFEGFVKKIKITSVDHTKQSVNMAVYSFLDDYYVKIENLIHAKNKIFLIIFEAKEKDSLSQKKMVDLEKEFLNELTYCVIREEVSKRNKRIREAMVAQFLLSAVGGLDGIDQGINNNCSKNKDDEKFQNKNNSFDKLDECEKEKFSGISSDPLGIAVSWEDKNKKGARKNKK